MVAMKRVLVPIVSLLMTSRNACVESKKMTRRTITKRMVNTMRKGKGTSNDLGNNNNEFNNNDLNDNLQVEDDYNIRHNQNEKMIQIDEDDIDNDINSAIYVNPCTGSISLSLDSPPDITLPCLQATNMPSPRISPAPSKNLNIRNKLTASPTISKVPTLSPSSTPSTFVPSQSPSTEYIDKIVCPGEAHSCDAELSNNTLVVNFKYSVETTNTTKDPYDVLPQLEETLLQKLAEKLLPSHCLTGFNFRNLLLHNSRPKLRDRKSQVKGLKRYHRRKLLEIRRRLEAVGICSTPNDEHITEESCGPELKELNNCYVIEGGVTVSVNEEDNDIITYVQNATKEIMVNDELLTDENPEVEKVKYLEDDPNNIPFDEDTLQRATGEPPISIMIGASLAALAAILGMYMVKKKVAFVEKGKIEDDDIVLPSPAASFIPADGTNLGRHTSCMDVHECKSAVCPKCYEESGTTFIPSHPYIQLDVAAIAQLDTADLGQFSSDEDTTGTLEPIVSIDISDRT